MVGEEFEWVKDLSRVHMRSVIGILRYMKLRPYHFCRRKF